MDDERSDRRRTRKHASSQGRLQVWGEWVAYQFYNVDRNFNKNYDLVSAFLEVCDIMVWFCEEKLQKYRTTFNETT